MDNQEAAQKGGETGGEARQNFEKKTGRKVVSAKNFLESKSEDDSDKLPKG